MAEFDQRFLGMARLVGLAGLRQLEAAHVAVVGLGGVGSWAAEALVRSGVGAITLVDRDVISLTNANRQLHTLEETIGHSKAAVMAERLRRIHPHARIIGLQKSFDQATADELLATNFSAVVDAIDSPAQKALLIAACRLRQIPVFSSGGAGGRLDPGRIQTADLAEACYDRLLAEVRRLLRKHHGFPGANKPFGVPCVFSSEIPVRRSGSPPPDSDSLPPAGAGTDSRHGMGTAVFVTGSFGFALAGLVVRHLAGLPASHTPT